jgi:hypothetical protein
MVRLQSVLRATVSIRGIVVLSISLDAPSGKHTAIRKHDVVKRHARRAGFSRVTGRSNLVTGLEGVFAEAGAGHLMRITQFRSPMHDIAFIVCGIEKEAAVGI